MGYFKKSLIIIGSILSMTGAFYMYYIYLPDEAMNELKSYKFVIMRAKNLLSGMEYNHKKGLIIDEKDFFSSNLYRIDYEITKNNGLLDGIGEMYCVKSEGNQLKFYFSGNNMIKENGGGDDFFLTPSDRLR